MSDAIGRDSDEDVVNPTEDSTSESREPESTPHIGRRWRSATIWCVLLCTTVGYMVVFPVVETTIAAGRPVVQGYVLEDMSLAESIRLRFAEFLVVFWFFAVGASVGSFLNVVAGRMPSEKSIGGSSRCPFCNARIARWDIVPILGWLTLGGRCRACQEQISPRYPFVEALTGGMFLLLLFVELLSGCANVPFMRQYVHDGIVWILFYPKWDVVGIYAYHMTLLCFLLVVSLIDWDRARMPKRLVLAGVSLGAVLSAIWPKLQPVAWQMWHPNWFVQWPWLERLDTTLVGLVAGACIGAVLSTASPSADGFAETRGGIPASAPASMVLVGVFLGWQAAMSVAACTALFRLFVAMVAYRWPRIVTLPPGGWILVATILHICLWRVSVGWPFWPGPHSSAVALLISCAGVVAASVLTRLLSRRPQTGRAVDVNFGGGVPS